MLFLLQLFPAGTQPKRFQPQNTTLYCSSLPLSYPSYQLASNSWTHKMFQLVIIKRAMPALDFPLPVLAIYIHTAKCISKVR